MATIVNSVYKDLVLSVDNGLEQSLGITHLHLLWAELLQHAQVTASYYPDERQRSHHRYEQNLSRYIELAEKKGKNTNLLLRVRQMAMKRDANQRQRGYEACGARPIADHPLLHPPKDGEVWPQWEAAEQAPSPDRTPEVPETQNADRVRCADREPEAAERQVGEQVLSPDRQPKVAPPRTVAQMIRCLEQMAPQRYGPGSRVGLSRQSDDMVGDLLDGIVDDAPPELR
jgi:hypothetical protein